MQADVGNSEGYFTRAMGARLTRRQLMQRGAVAAGAVALSGALGNTVAACGGDEGGDDGASLEGVTLNWLTWGGHQHPSIIDPFTEATGIKIVHKPYEGGDQAIVEITQNPGKYDVTTTSMEYMPQYVASKSVMEMNDADYPEFQEYLPEFRKDIGYHVDGKPYTYLYEMGNMGLCINTTKVDEEETRDLEKLFTNKKYRGRIGSYDWWGNAMGPLSIACGFGPTNGRNPYDIDDNEFAELKRYMKSVRQQWAGFWPQADAMANVASGTIWIWPGGGDWAAAALQEQGHPVIGTVPDLGCLQWAEGISIVPGTQKLEAAKKFVHYMMSAQAQARLARKPAYSAMVPNEKAWTLLQEESPEWAKRLKMDTLEDPCAITPWREGKVAIRVLPKRQTIAEWQAAWDEFKKG